MRIRLFSDLHLEGCNYLPAPTPEPVDVVVLAGDIHKGTQGMDWARKHFPTETILYVAGNHEYYRNDLRDTLEDLKHHAEQMNILFLENRTVTLPEVRFIGATLWTDFRLYVSADSQGAGRTLSGTKRQTRESIQAAEVAMADFRVIRYQGQFLWPELTRRFHRESRRFIEAQINQPFAGKTMVITHHAPSFLSIPSQFQAELSSAGFASNLDELVAKADFWVHGHTHESRDYRIGPCRVLCNPRGYVGRNLTEYTGFTDPLVIDTDA